MLFDIVEKHAPHRHSGEVGWAIWACIAMRIPLNTTTVRAALRIEDSICALLLLHARRQGLVENPTDLNELRRELTANALYGPRWLLAYEANVKGWFRFRGAADYVSSDRNFGLLKAARVSFYDETKTALPTSEVEEAVDDLFSPITRGYGAEAEEDDSDDEDDTDEFGHF